MKLTPETIRIARLAVRHMALGVKSWAEMPDEENARRQYESLREVDRELGRALDISREAT